jgi:hypothetical protein
MTSTVVVGAGVPHVPVFPSLVQNGDSGIGDRFSRAQQAVQRSHPDLLVIIASDHLNSLYLDKLPSLSINVSPTFRGPSDNVSGMTESVVDSDSDVAGQLATSLVGQGFDLTVCRDLLVDHSVMVPLHFLNPAGLPAIVVHVNAYTAPRPSPARCYDFGSAIHDTITRLAGGLRVGVVTSGSFSQDVGGSKVDPGRTWSVPRPEWAAHVAARLAAGELEQLVREVTPSALEDAGSVAGEVLPWIVAAGILGPRGARLAPTVDYIAGEAYAFATWTEGEA